MGKKTGERGGGTGVGVFTMVGGVTISMLLLSCILFGVLAGELSSLRMILRMEGILQRWTGSQRTLKYDHVFPVPTGLKQAFICILL